MKKNELLLLSLVLTAANFSPLSVSVLGFAIRIVDQDPAAMVRGNAFIATADNPTAIYFNPSGITEFEGKNVSVGLERKYEHWHRDVACQPDYGHSFNLTGGISNLPTGGSADSHYEYISHGLTYTV